MSKQCEKDFIKLLSVLSTESIWMGVSRLDEDRIKAFIKTKALFAVEKSDHFPLVLIYDAWKKKLSQSH